MSVGMKGVGSAFKESSAGQGGGRAPGARAKAPRLRLWGAPAHRIFYHPAVTKILEELGQRALWRRLVLLLLQLAVEGQTTGFKVCATQEERGWLRASMGGTGGNQFYLYWTSAGRPPVRHLDLAKGDIVVRIVRHHDDHDALSAGRLDDYLLLDCESIADGETLLPPPWTPHQKAFAGDAAPIRLLQGGPGTGKTSALLEAIATLAPRKVLYLTWSRALVQRARDHLRVFASTDTRVLARDFGRLFAELAGCPPSGQTTAEGIRRLKADIAQRSPHQLGPWRGREDALHAELRAHLFGDVRLLDGDLSDLSGMSSLFPDRYLSERSQVIGAEAAEAALRLAGLLRAPQCCFPELVVASRAWDALARDPLPEALLGVDCLAVDEVQDLTPLELNVLIRLAQRLEAEPEGRVPALIIAGDEGQTVRPTGFDWNAFKRLLSGHLGDPVEHHLGEGLRCPRAIAEAIDYVSGRYVDIPKEVRPGKRFSLPEAGGGGRLFLTRCAEAEAGAFLMRLGTLEDVVLLTPESALAEGALALPEDAILTAEQAKGLEYQSVCVLNPGRALGQAGGDWDRLGQSVQRGVLDRLRVSLSRATESLALIEFDGQGGSTPSPLSAIPGIVELSPEELLMELRAPDVPLEERLNGILAQIPALQQAHPARAWSSAKQAVQRLAALETAQGSIPPELKREVHRRLVWSACHLLIDGAPPSLSLSAVMTLGKQSAREIKGTLLARRFNALVAWRGLEARGLWAVLEVFEPRGEGDDLGHAIARIAEELRQALSAAAASPLTAKRFARPAFKSIPLGERQAAGWTLLQRQAFETLLLAGHLKEAEAVLDAIPGELLRLKARLLEAQGLLEDAAGHWELLGEPNRARPLWRKASHWERALTLTTPSVSREEIKELRWLVELTELVARRPKGLHEGFAGKEAERYYQLMETLIGEE